MAVPPREDVQAARRYGRLVDDIAAGYRNPLTGGRLSGAALLLKVASGESGFRSDRTSTAGAKGRTQFTPGSRSTAISRFGIDPWRSTDEAYHAAALHLLGKINGSKGLEGYNPGSSSYPSYILNQKVGKVGGGSSSGGGPPPSPASVLIQAAGGSPQTAEPGADITPMLAALMQRPPGPPVSAPAPVAHAAHAALPQGYQAPSAGGGAVSARPSVDALLDAVRTQGGSIPGVDAPSVSEVRIQGSGGASVRAGSGRTPTATAGKVIGTPYAGTHTLGDWQSDNAVDIAVPEGTPMVALQDGVIVKVRHHPQDGGRFAGDQITVRGRNGNEYFYAHGKAGVKPGQRVKRGQSLGVTGSASGVAHLHFGQKRGDPRQHVRRS